MSSNEPEENDENDSNEFTMWCSFLLQTFDATKDLSYINSLLFAY